MPRAIDTSLLEALAAFEFSVAEARAFLALLARGAPSPLSGISWDAGLPRSTAHSALKALAKRGLIFCEGSYPARYVAAPVSRLGSLAAASLERARRAAAAADLVARFAKG